MPSGNVPSVLLDKNIPWGIRRHLAGHTVRTTEDEGRSDLSNGDLLLAAERAGFEVMLTADQRIRYQQNLTGRRLALIVLSSPAWPVVKDHIPAIEAAVDAATPGSYHEVHLLHPVLRGGRGAVAEAVTGRRTNPLSREWSAGTDGVPRRETRMN